MQVSNEEAFAMIVGHHRQLREQVARLVSILEQAVANNQAYEIPRARLVFYLADEVLPHALAEEDTIYARAAKIPSLTTTVASMVDEHRNLALGIERLASATSATSAVRHARSLAALFESHVIGENEVLLPPLVSDETVNVAQLLSRMQHLTRANPEKQSSVAATSGVDHEAVVFSQLLAATTMLAGGGSGGEACSMIAATWAALRAPRPDLANKATFLLHGLVRMAGGEPTSLRAGQATSRADTDSVLDVRSLAPAQRHERIFGTYGALTGDAAFLLINDHDPKPLRYQFEAEHLGEFTWDYVESGPKVWRVRIGRAATTYDTPLSTGDRG